MRGAVQVKESQRALGAARGEPALSPREEIARVAYELFRQRGGVHGHDLEDWLKAEQIVRQRLQQRRRA